MTNVNIESVELEPQAALAVHRRVAVSEFGKVLTDIYTRVHRHIAQAGQQPAGMPFMRYFSMDGVACDIAAGMPVSERIGDEQGGVALRAHRVAEHRGDGWRRPRGRRDA
jgi:hypothetical protein